MKIDWKFVPASVMHRTEYLRGENGNRGRTNLPEREKTFHHDGFTSRTNADYTIAWVCALHTELAAARVMLDIIHEPLPQFENDTNSYLLGSIRRHNIVIACLPADDYGTISAAAVIMNLKRSFPEVRAGLMVGVGGGVPTRANDLRLGDIVVGTRVIQHDVGNVVEDEEFRRTAMPKALFPFLHTAVSALRAKHESTPSRVPLILQRFRAHPAYNRPNLPDRLFQMTYGHKPLRASCDECDQSKVLARDKRMQPNIKIHYGGIASGNQVMKSGIVRDQVAQELDVICFEMETAGLMDVLPCLPIRGICDYADSHKTKEWQRYAAAAAAAYAREFLEEFPAVESEAPIFR